MNSFTIAVTAAALVTQGLAGCATAHRKAQTPCVAQPAPLPAPERAADGRYVIHMNEKSLAGRPERFPYLVVVDGNVVTTIRDSIAGAQLWARSPGVVPLEQVESVNILDGDSAVAAYGVPGATRAYVFTTCHARRSS